MAASVGCSATPRTLAVFALPPMNPGSPNVDPKLGAVLDLTLPTSSPVAVEYSRTMLLLVEAAATNGAVEWIAHKSMPSETVEDEGGGVLKLPAEESIPLHDPKICEEDDGIALFEPAATVDAEVDDDTLEVKRNDRLAVNTAAVGARRSHTRTSPDLAP